MVIMNTELPRDNIPDLMKSLSIDFMIRLNGYLKEDNVNLFSLFFIFKA